MVPLCVPAAEVADREAGAAACVNPVLSLNVCCPGRLESGQPVYSRLSAFSSSERLVVGMAALP